MADDERPGYDPALPLETMARDYNKHTQWELNMVADPDVLGVALADSVLSAFYLAHHLGIDLNQLIVDRHRANMKDDDLPVSLRNTNG